MNNDNVRLSLCILLVLKFKYYLLQSISPGLVETEFAQRMQKSEEKAKALYSSIKV